MFFGENILKMFRIFFINKCFTQLLPFRNREKVGSLCDLKQKEELSYPALSINALSNVSLSTTVFSFANDGLNFFPLKHSEKYHC